MNRLDKVLKGLECCSDMGIYDCKQCPYSNECLGTDSPYGIDHLAADALKELKEYDIGMQTLGEMNDDLCEKIAIKQFALKRIADISYDYDGYDSVEGLKSLIDEIREIAINGVQNAEVY